MCRGLLRDGDDAPHRALALMRHEFSTQARNLQDLDTPYKDVNEEEFFEGKEQFLRVLHIIDTNRDE